MYTLRDFIMDKNVLAQFKVMHLIVGSDLLDINMLENGRILKRYYSHELSNYTAHGNYITIQVRND